MIAERNADNSRVKACPSQGGPQRHRRLIKHSTHPKVALADETLGGARVFLFTVKAIAQLPCGPQAYTLNVIASVLPSTKLDTQESRAYEIYP
jgi:hypothetical protein